MKTPGSTGGGDAAANRRRRPSRWLRPACAACVAIAQGLCAQNSAAAPVRLCAAEGGWQVDFDPACSALECRHTGGEAALKGRLSFAAELDGARAAWTIQPARDGTAQRLALVDPRGDAQGYVTARADGGLLVLTVLHRPPHNFPGELVYEPDIRFGAGAYACRTRVPGGGEVVQMASGPADSLLNDSLFDPLCDCALTLDGQRVSVHTTPHVPGEAPVFAARLAACPEQDRGAAIAVELIRDYYRARYVPYYHPIDRTRCPSAPTGWMSWNVYFDTAGEEENLAEARVGAAHLKPFGLSIWSIESWQDNSPRLPVSDFHNLTLRPSPAKFPHGMQWLATQIRALGFRPGIWTVPFGTGDRAFYEAHRGWFLHAPDGTPMQNWCGRFILDPSQPEVRRHMEESHRTMSTDWGYEFFKIDGMSGRNPGYSAHFFERPDVRAAFKVPGGDPYPSCIEALRKGIGPDRIFLACQGHYTGPEAAWADAARLGADIVHPNRPPHWENHLNQARLTLNQLFVHNLLWYSDPDTLLVGEAAPLSTARLAAAVVGLPGQLTFFGDKLAALPPERMRLLQQVLPVCDVRPLDLAPIHTLKAVWDLKIRRPFASWDAVAVFNWDAQPRTATVAFAALGLDAEQDYLVREFWSGAFLGARRGSVDVPLSPRSCALLAVHPQLDRPQLLGTDRHVCQGGVEWTACAWDAARGTLTCDFDLVENDPLTAAIHVPAGYALAGAAAEGGAELVAGPAGSPPVLTVTLRRPARGEGRLVATFTKK